MDAILAIDALSFAADAYNRCPTEPMRFFLRLASGEAPGSAEVAVPPALLVERFGLEGAEGPSQRVYAVEHEDGALVRWEWEQGGPSGELVIAARAGMFAPDGAVTCRARRFDETGETVADAGLRVMVRRQSGSLSYLPEIYREDDFTGRFMMLFDSFWKPISGQIDSMPNYFDPYLTTPEMLPWLGSWFGLAFDDSLPEARKRDLLAKIFPIYARKGTRAALETCLKMYTGGEVQIREHRDTNLVLGEAAYLGYQVALGTQNRPHSFEVQVTVPAGAAPDDEAAREQYRGRVEALIGMYKPAHTVFHLDLTFA